MPASQPHGAFALALALLASLDACVARGTTERQCRLNSECAPPLVCREGVCAPECEADRDCPRGQVCATSGSGARACVTETDAGGDDAAVDATTDEGDAARDAAADAADARTDGGACARRPPPETAVVVGNAHTCARRGGGAVGCWGWNIAGQVGDGTVADRANPVPLAVDARTIVRVAHGFVHSCAVLEDGRLWCWGANCRGQLGVASTGRCTANVLTEPYCGPGATFDCALAPMPVAALGAAVVDAAAGAGHTCAVLADGAVSCWGDNTFGQLGAGDSAPRAGPVTVAGLRGVDRIAAGEEHTCALRCGEVWCWGRNHQWQLGTNAVPFDGRPRRVALPEAAVDVATRVGHACALLASGAVWCWGASESGQAGGGRVAPAVAPGFVRGLGDAATTAIAVGWQHSCAVSGGVVRCWGLNDVGQLGIAPGGARDAPTPIADGMTGVTALAAGTQHTCGYAPSGAVYCWGTRRNGRLGDGLVAGESAGPQRVAGF